MKVTLSLVAASIAALFLANGVALTQEAGPRALTPPPPPPPLPLNGPIIKVKQGEVQGSLVDDVAIFRGLPFAAPPVGELRWREPKPPAKWVGVRAGNVFGSSCNQAEDCLYLNLYKPANTTKQSKLPVMFYMHGGGFVGGSGAPFDGTHFAKQGVILIATNYRLGRAGWFAHPALTKEKAGLLGNYGNMDQIAALRWIKDNIEAFGGDPKNVTIFGGSAGAVSVNYLMIAPQARGLFHKALSESGFGRIAALPLHAPEGVDSAEKIGLGFADALGIKGDDKATAKALRTIPWTDMTRNVGGVGAATQPKPMLDGKLFKTTVYEGFAKHNEARVPYVLGGNSDEASLTRRSTNSAERFAAIKSQREEFLKVFDPNQSGDTERVVARLITDQTISEPDRALARLHATHGSPTFVYHFSYVPLAQRTTAFGMGHGGETPYVFNTPRPPGFDEEGKSIATAANNYWVAFAKTGDPASAGGTTWPKFDAAEEMLLEFPFGGIPTVQKHFHADRLNWVEQSLSN
jgi:para-nitrobenzyl esterase